MYCKNAFIKILSKTGLVGKDPLGSRKDNPSMVDFGYNSNASRNQKHFKPIANGNVADIGMIALTDEPLPCPKR